MSRITNVFTARYEAIVFIRTNESELTGHTTVIHLMECLIGLNT